MKNCKLTETDKGIKIECQIRRNNKKFRKQETFTGSRRAAERRAREIINELEDRAEADKNPKPKMKHVIEEYQNKKYDTYKKSESHFKHLLKIGDASLENIDNALKEYLDNIDLSESTKETIIRQGKAACNCVLGYSPITLDTPKHRQLMKEFRARNKKDGIFLMVNGAKKEIRVDLLTPQKRNMLLEIFEDLDIEAESDSVGVTRKPKNKAFGIDYRFGKWRARITVNGKRVNLGTYNTEEEAKNARLKAEKEYGVTKK